MTCYEIRDENDLAETSDSPCISTGALRNPENPVGAVRNRFRLAGIYGVSVTVTMKTVYANARERI
jgi:hypothetical protein